MYEIENVRQSEGDDGDDDDVSAGKEPEVLGRPDDHLRHDVLLLLEQLQQDGNHLVPQGKSNLASLFGRRNRRP